MSNTEWTDGDWYIQRQGRSTYYCRNDKVGLTMSVETKATLKKKLAKVNAELSKDPKAVPSGCHTTPERNKAEWQAQPYAQKLAQTDKLVVYFLRSSIRRSTESENILLQTETVNQLLYDMRDERIIDCMCRPYYERILIASVEDRQTQLREETKILRKRVEGGYKPTTTSPLSVAMEHLQHLTYVRVYDEFKAFLAQYDNINKEEKNAKHFGKCSVRNQGE